MAAGRNNTVTDKYVTITVEADDFEHATSVLARVATESIAQLRSVGGCRAERVSGEERVRLLHDILRPDQPFRFTYNDLVGSTLTTKDVVSPWLLIFGKILPRSRFLTNTILTTRPWFYVTCLLGCQTG